MRLLTGISRGLVLLILLLTSVVDCVRAGEDSTVSDGEPAAASTALRRVAEKVQPSIVTIEVQSGPRETARWARLNNVSSDGAGGDRYPSQKGGGARDGEGTGIIFDTSGHILTCNHVVDGAEALFVRLHDGHRVEVKKVMQDPFTDIAVIQISYSGPLKVPEFAIGSSPQIGDYVIAIGNPYGLGVSMSGGVVSATGRYLSHLPSTPLIQTDAATNPGSSGGAIVDTKGRVIGMSEGGYGVHEGFQGIGFAIPIAKAVKSAQRLIDTGTATHPFFGFDTEELTDEMSRHLGLTEPMGLIVCDVAPHSAAQNAGVCVGDVLLRIDGTQIKDRFHFMELVDGDAPYPPAHLTLSRAGTLMEIIVTPDVLPQSPRQKLSEEGDGTSSEYFDRTLGLSVDVLTEETSKRLEYSAPADGLLVTYVDPRGSAAKQGICAGMSLLRVEDRRVRTPADYRSAMDKVDASNGVLLLIGTSRNKHFVLCK